MKKIVYVLLLALVGLNISAVQAQTKQYYSVGWDVSMPIGSFSDYISNTSLQGGNFSGNIFLKESVSVGFKFGYNTYNENVDRQTYQLKPGNAITAASYNYIISAPIQLGVYYHFNAGETIEPYAGLGLGVNYMNEQTLIQDYSLSDDQWPFLINPEVGLRYQFSDSPFAIKVSAGYNYNFNSYKVWGIEYKNFQAVNINLALSWTIK